MTMATRDNIMDIPAMMTATCSLSVISDTDLTKERRFVVSRFFGMDEIPPGSLSQKALWTFSSDAILGGDMLFVGFRSEAKLSWTLALFNRTQNSQYQMKKNNLACAKGAEEKIPFALT